MALLTSNHYIRSRLQSDLQRMSSLRKSNQADLAKTNELRFNLRFSFVGYFLKGPVQIAGVEIEPEKGVAVGDGKDVV